jgi:hypothetical protein
MIRTSAAVILALLTLAPPAWAGDPRFATPSVVMPRSFSTSTPLPPSLPFVVATKPFMVTAPGAIVRDPRPVFVPVPHHRHHPGTTTFISSPTTTQVVVVPQPVVVPQTVYVAPQECVTQGYWSYRWIPYTTTQNVWVPGAWAANGTWTDSHWEMRPYSSGYYEPFWVPGEPYAC